MRPLINRNTLLHWITWPKNEHRALEVACRCCCSNSIDNLLPWLHGWPHSLSIHMACCDCVWYHTSSPCNCRKCYSSSNQGQNRNELHCTWFRSIAATWDGRERQLMLATQDWLMTLVNSNGVPSERDYRRWERVKSRRLTRQQYRVPSTEWRHVITSSAFLCTRDDVITT